MNKNAANIGCTLALIGFLIICLFFAYAAAVGGGG